MRLTKATYQRATPLLCKALAQSDLIAIDFEFSGHTKHQSLTNSRIDTAEDRYWKQRTAINPYLPLQLGITGAEFKSPRKNGGVAEVTLYPFNIPLRPCTTESEALPQKYLMDTSSLDFLHINGFNFAQSFRDGVNYASMHSVGQMYVREAGKRNDDRDSLVRAARRVGLLAEKGGDSESIGKMGMMLAQNGNLKNIERIFARDELSAHAGNSELIAEGLKTMMSRERKIQFAGKSIDNLAAAFRKSEMPPYIPDLLGVTRLVHYISRLNKPLIVHNGVLDLMLLHKEFMEPLPEDLAEYRAGLHSWFPTIYDTKHMAGSLASLYVKYPDSRLSALYGQAVVQNAHAPKFAIHPAFGEYNLKSEAFHEAGFDSMMTAAVFSTFFDQLHESFGKMLAGKLLEVQCKNKLPASGFNVPYDLEDTERRQCGQEEVFAAVCSSPRLNQEDIVDAVRSKFSSRAKIVRLFRQNAIFFTIMDMEEAGTVRKRIDAGVLSLKSDKGEVSITTHEKYMAWLKDEQGECPQLRCR